jgi:protein involved in polysaccharide export with SLBB domain
MFNRAALLMAMTILALAPHAANAQDLQRPHVSSDVGRINDIKARSGMTNNGSPQQDPQSAEAPSLFFFDPSAPQTYKQLTPTNAQPVYSALQQPAQKPENAALETMYSERIVQELQQYGYDLFGYYNPAANTLRNDQPPMPPGAVQDDFILGSGDELEIVFTGQRNDRGVYRISSKGYLLVQDFPPIPAAGRAIGQVRDAMQAVAGNLHNTEIFVSLASVRQISVLVVGHVKKPGRQTLTVFDTVLDALMASGGIEKTGSLRQIKLVRDGRSMMIDLYGLLMHGSTNVDFQLRDGDRIIIPAIGPTVAVAGEVKRPGIYELQADVKGMYYQPFERGAKLSLNEMLELGGGVLIPGKNRLLKLEVTPGGQENVEEMSEGFAPVFGDGSILMVSKGQEKRAGLVELAGNTRHPGMHALAENPNLSSLLSSEDVMAPETYPLIGVIERWDSSLLTKSFIDFPLRLVLRGSYDLKLQDGDVVHLFSDAQVDHLSQNFYAQTQEKQPDVGSMPDDEDAAENERSVIEDPALANFLRERATLIRGAVRKPGAYPVTEGTTLDGLLGVAGGLSLEANPENIEITSLTHDGENQQKRRKINLQNENPENIIILSGDAIRINQKFRKLEDDSVLIMGEVQNPGRYDLMPGDRISDLLERAGGLTSQAYPPAAIFSRESERKAEEARFKSQGRAIKKSIGETLAMDDKKIDTGKIAEARALADELENAQGLGRITVEADPEILTARPALDMLLEPGDRMYIPKRSLTVRVTGEVLSAANLQFREDKKPLDYIHEAGGFSFHADKDRTFVLYPDGSAQPLEVSAWNYNPVFVPPGSTLVVPRDPEPFDFIENAKDISQILSNLAITAIFIDDVVNDDF